MKLTRLASFSFVAIATSLAFACGGADTPPGATFNSSGGSTSGTNSGGTNSGGANSGGTDSGGTNSGGPIFTPTGDGGTNSGTTNSGPTEQNCAATNVATEQLPVYLVIMFDKSRSMILDNSNQEIADRTKTKWFACGEGLKSFFGDASSKGVSAAISFFPAFVQNPNSQGSNFTCQPEVYAQPDLDMTALPNAGAFTTVFAQQEPYGGTPTYGALAGAWSYAETVVKPIAEAKQGKIAVVLVSDGNPSSNDVCDGTFDRYDVDNLNFISNETKAVFDTLKVPTYAIGIGNISALNSIAAAGGTNKAFEISTTNAAATAQQFQNALNTIRGAQLSCEYTIPTPPDGKTLDYGAVNVEYTSGAGQKSTLAYEKDCAAAGWRYDNAAKPTKIQLCKATCDAVKADSKPKVDVAYGCATKGTDGTIPR